MSLLEKRLYEFGPYRLDAPARVLLRDKEVVPLAPKALDLLITLVEQSGHVLSKDELMKQVWPDTIVEEANLSHHVFTLRKALEDDKNGAKYIETIPRRGYRFVASVTTIGAETDDLVVAEHSRARIVIEQSETPEPIDDDSALAHASGVVALEQASAPREGFKRRLLFFALSCAALVVSIYQGMTNNAARKQPAIGVKSIAVLPFKPLVAGERNESLELGMADTLITRLSNIRQLTVRPTSAVRKYGDLQQDAVAAGRELQVDSVLDGNIQKSGERLRVTARLVNIQDGATLWAAKFDESVTDIFALQDSISEKVAGALALELSAVEKERLAKRSTENTEAYQLYLKGHFEWGKFTAEGRATSINYFNAALEKDPRYALAYTGLANVYSVMAIYGPLLPKEAQPKQKEAALTALKLDPNLAQAQVAVGGLNIFYNWDWPSAERAFKRALELNPSYVDAHTLYGYYLQAMGRVDEAVVELQRAWELDPTWSLSRNDVIMGRYFARRYDEVIKQSQQQIKLEPNISTLHRLLGMGYAQKGLYGEAIAAFQNVLSLPRDTANKYPYHFTLAELGYAKAKSGKPDEALRLVAKLKEDEHQAPPVSFSIAIIYAGMGDKDQAFAYLNQAYEERYPFLWRLKVHPEFDSLRSDQRYADLLRRLGLPQ